MIKGDLYVVKRLALIMAVLLLATSLALPAYAADWPQFQRDAKNSGIYDSGTALPTTTPTATSVYLQGGPPQFFGIDSCPIYVTTGGTGYTYVFPTNTLYEHYTSGNSLLLKDSLQLVSPGGFQLSTPASDGSSIYVATNDMFNQTQNKDFTTSLDGWTTGSSINPPPAITQATVSSQTCAKIDEDSPSTNGDGWVQQSVNIPDNTTVRVAFSYFQQYDDDAPSQHDFLVRVKKSSDPDIPANWQTIITTTSATYGSWLPVNNNISSSYFPTVGVSYDFRFLFDYNTAADSNDTYGCFTDCQVIVQSFGVKKITGLDTGTLSLDPNFSGGLGTVRGQANTPVKYYSDATGNYLVVGQYGSGSYFCLDPATGNKKWQYTPSPATTFYWAGAAVAKGVAIFGDDNGNVHVVLLNQSGTATEVDQDPNTPGIQPYKLSTTPNEKVRSSICYYDTGGGANSTDYLYLTTRTDTSGSLYQLAYNITTHIITAAGNPVSDNYSTSTPVRYDNYVFFGASGLYVSQISNGTLGTPASISAGLFSPALGAVQSSPVVQKTGSVYNVYATENKANGRAFCINYNSSNNTSSLGWSTPSQNFVLQGFAAADGKLFYGDDAGYFYYLH